MSGPYDDIIHLPHHISQKRGRMSLLDRAAQFSPFAALTGYEAAVEETARLTDQRIELDVDARIDLDRMLFWLQSEIRRAPKVAVTYFLPDRHKSGGAYVTVSGTLRKINTLERWLLLDRTKIPMEDVLSITEEDEKSNPLGGLQTGET